MNGGFRNGYFLGYFGAARRGETESGWYPGVPVSVGAQASLAGGVKRRSGDGAEECAIADS